MGFDDKGLSVGNCPMDGEVVGVKIIPLTQKRFAIVDSDDYPELAQYHWSLDSLGYAQRAHQKNGKWQPLRMQHQIITDIPGGSGADHINGNKLDNRKSNLRVCTQKQNCWNAKPRPGRSKYKGVWWNAAAKKWSSIICTNGKRAYLGVFETEQSAAKAYDKAAKASRGKYAYLNFPD